jgi:release factor glutamine methyltransferase
VESARLDAEVLLAAACGTDRSTLYARAGEPVPPACHDRLRAMLVRRLAREPLPYIVGRKEFWSLDFVVTPAVLIPRPETELLVELSIETTNRRGSPARLCDLGTGSGCIAVVLAREVPGAEVWAVDVSEAALAVAATNARQHGVAARIHFMASDLLGALARPRFDLIVSNPPYVATADLAHSQPELRWEPHAALDGGQAGLETIRRVLAAAPAHLAEGGWLMMEFGADQAAAVTGLARAAGLRDLSVRRDCAGRPRVLVARK